jgi:hypothetical protein
MIGSTVCHLRFSSQILTPQSTMSLSLSRQSTWSRASHQKIEYDGSMEFLDRFENMSEVDTLSPQTSQPNVHTYLPVRDWQDDNEEFQEFSNPTMASGKFSICMYHRLPQRTIWLFCSQKVLLIIKKRE